MLKDDFIKRMLGIPWVNRACSFDAADCWGLVILYYHHVLGIEIVHSPDYENGAEFNECYDKEVFYWRRSEAIVEDGVFIAYYGKQPVHIGLIINGQAMHSRGENGHIRIDPIRTIQKLFTKVEFYTYAANRNSASSGLAERKGSA